MIIEAYIIGLIGGIVIGIMIGVGYCIHKMHLNGYTWRQITKVKI